jgi:zinc protease
VVLNPAFFADEISRLRSETLDDLEVRLESPGTLARYTAARVAFGDGAYGHPPDGTPETVKRLTRDDVLRFHAAHFHPGNAVLVLGGDLTPEEGFALAEKTLGNWARKSTTTARVTKTLKPTPIKTGRVVVVDMPDAGQAAVYLIRHGIRRADPEYYQAIVADAVLGRGFSSRINQEVRIKRGLSYGAGSALDARRDIGPFVLSAQTKHETAAEVAVLLKSELTRLASGSLLATELTPRKASLTGDYARSLETGGGLVAEVAELALYNLPLVSLGTYLPSVQEVTASQVKAIATKRLNARDASIIIVGDGRKFLTPLRARFKNVEVIPVDKLDLNRAALRR